MYSMFCLEIANKSIENLRFIPKQKIWKYILKLAWKVYLKMVMFTSSNGIWYHVIKIYSIYCFMLYNKAALTFYKYAYPLRELDSDHCWHNEESPLLLPGLKLSVWKNMSTSCQLKFSRRATDLRLVPELITN